jgi:hypothetical protein
MTWRTLSTDKTWRGLPPEPAAVFRKAAPVAETELVAKRPVSVSALSDQGAGDIPVFLRRVRA